MQRTADAGMRIRRRVIGGRLCFALGGLCMMFAVLPTALTAVVLLSCAVHECGHLALMRMLGIRAEGIRAVCGGAVLHGRFSESSYFREIVCAAAGPVVNLLLAAVFWGSTESICAVNVLLACYNLLPMRGNDGAVMLLAAAEAVGRGDGMRRCLRALDGLLTALLMMLGAWILWFGALSDAGGSSLGYGALFFCVLLRAADRTDGHSGTE